MPSFLDLEGLETYHEQNKNYIDSKNIELTQAEYDALSDSKLTDGISYHITDSDSELNAKSLDYDNSTSGLEAVNIQDAIDSLSANVDAAGLFDATEIQDSITQLNSDLANVISDLISGITANDTTLASGTLTSPSQLTHAGYYQINAIDNAVNDDITNGGYTYTDTGVGDYRCLLLSRHVNESNGCSYGTLIVTSPRTDNIWVGRIWAGTFRTWRKIALNSDLAGYSKLTYSTTEPTSNLTTNMIWIG